MAKGPVWCCHARAVLQHARGAGNEGVASWSLRASDVTTLDMSCRNKPMLLIRGSSWAE